MKLTGLIVMFLNCASAILLICLGCGTYLDIPKLNAYKFSISIILVGVLCVFNMLLIANFGSRLYDKFPNKKS